MWFSILCSNGNTVSYRWSTLSNLGGCTKNTNRRTAANISKPKLFVCQSHFLEEDLIIENDAIVRVHPGAVPQWPDGVVEDNGYFIV
jgi:hypothetical protein